MRRGSMHTSVESGFLSNLTLDFLDDSGYVRI